LWSWQETIKAVFLNRVNILSEYEDIVHSPSCEIKLPSVISLKEYVHQSRDPAFTRFNVFLRDGFCCQYCNLKLPTQNLTFDHVVPRSLGGRTNWSNVVTACQKCNFKKGNKVLKVSGLALKKIPKQPSTWLLQENGRGFPPNFLHQSWRDYLYWDTELENN
jgi:5-methylcytosine-specific restriction endonuclease McrA